MADNKDKDLTDAEKMVLTAGGDSGARALAALSGGEVNLDSLRSLDETEAGEEAIPIEDLEDPFAIVSAYVTPVMWPGGDDGGAERQGFTTHMLCMTDPSKPRHFVEVYSNSDAVAAKVQTLIDRDGLSPDAPVLCRFEEKQTRKFRVHKLTNPTKQEVQNFKLAVAAAIKDAS